MGPGGLTTGRNCRDRYQARHPARVRQDGGRRRRHVVDRGWPRAGSAGGAATLRHRRHRRSRSRHVGTIARGEVFRRAGVRRTLRRERPTGRRRTRAHGRDLPDLSELRGDVRESQTRPADGHDRRRLSSRVHREGTRPGHRRHDREADGHRRTAMPGGARRREAEQSAASSSPSTTATRRSTPRSRKS